MAAKGKVAIINFDQNTVCLRRLPKEVQDKIVLINPYLDKNGKEVAVTKMFSNFMDLVGLVVDNPEITTLVIDSLTTMAEAVHWQLLGRKDPMAKPNGYDHWSYFQNHWRYFASEVLHNEKLDKHIIVIAHDAVEKNSITGEVRREILLDGGMKDKFGLHFSDVWRCYPKVPTAGSVDYRIRTVPGPGYVCKCSIDLPEDFSFDDKVHQAKLIDAFQPIPSKE
jgi:hypothetical protein